MKNYDFDSILFPINFVCWNAGNFGPQVFEEAEKRGMGVLALKAMALTRLEEGEQKFSVLVHTKNFLIINIDSRCIGFGCGINIVIGQCRNYAILY